MPTYPSKGPVSPYPPSQIDHFDDYVRGFPMHVAVTVRLDSDGDASWVRGNVPQAGMFVTANLSVGLVDAATGEAVAIRGFGGRRSDCYSCEMVRGEHRRMLVDLSDFGVGDAPAGKYEVTVRYDGVAAEPFSVRIHEPSAAQKAELAKLELERGGYTWSQWVELKPESAGELSGAVNPADPLRFNRWVRYLLFARQISTAGASHLTGVYAPEAHLLQAEVARIHGDRANYANAAKYLRAKYPGLVECLDDIDRDEGFLSVLRSMAGGRPVMDDTFGSR